MKNEFDLTPKEKAKDLISQYSYLFTSSSKFQRSKTCALLAVDELIYNCEYGLAEYFRKVKIEIELTAGFNVRTNAD